MKPLARGSRPLEPNVPRQARKNEHVAEGDASWAAIESPGPSSTALRSRVQDLYIDSPEACQVATVGPQSQPDLGCLPSTSSRLLDALRSRGSPWLPIFMVVNPTTGGVGVVSTSPPYRTVPPSKRRVVWVWACVSGPQSCAVERCQQRRRRRDTETRLCGRIASWTCRLTLSR